MERFAPLPLAKAQADPQSRARDLQGANGDVKPVSDLVPADSLCYPVLNFRDIFEREFCWLSTLKQRHCLHILHRRLI